jgi:hypothetical protein
LTPRRPDFDRGSGTELAIPVARCPHHQHSDRPEIQRQETGDKEAQQSPPAAHRLKIKLRLSALVAYVDLSNGRAGWQVAGLFEQLRNDVPIHVEVRDLKIDNLVLATKKERNPVSYTLPDGE